MAQIERRKFGNTGLEVSVLGFGGAEIGLEGATLEQVAELLNGALDAGLNVIDTAECYANSEELIGEAVAGRRADFHLFTKCGHVEGGRGDWGRDALLRSIERSLARLRTDHVDLVQLHSCSLDVLRQGDAIEALEEARCRGHTRLIGYSGDGAAAQYAVECRRFDALQTSLNIADQEVLATTLPMARERGMGVIIKRPVANAAWKTGDSPPESSYHTVYWERLRKLDYPFLEGEMSAAVGMALRFTLGQRGVHTAIVGTKQPGRWAENAALLEAGPLPPDEMAAIRQRWAKVTGPDWVAQT